MRHGGEIDDERGGPKVVNRRPLSLGACGEHRFFKLQQRSLTISLPEGYQSNPGGHQIGDVTLQEGGQGQANRNTLPRRANPKNDREGRLNMAFAQYFRKPIQESIGPYPTQRYETGCALLR